jgi:2-dehydropantoate 2-reductase
VSQAEPHRVLVVGAGAVGQVFGRALQRGGAQLSFFVRPQYAAALAGGVVVYPLNERPDRAPVRLDGYGVLSDVSAVAASRWDEVWLCVSSPALAGPWLGALAAAAPGATWVLLQPGLDDRALLLQHVPAERLVQGLITFMSWMAPLPGEQVPTPGVMSWQPPLSPAPFSGPPAVVGPLVARLRRGGQPARVAADVDLETALGSALLLPIVGELERCGWSFARMRAEGGCARAAVCAQATVRAAAAARGVLPPLWLSLIQGWGLSVASRLAPLVTPHDMERFFERHFSKVGDQTRLSLEVLATRGAASGLDVGPIRDLRAALGAPPSKG